MKYMMITTILIVGVIYLLLDKLPVNGQKLKTPLIIVGVLVLIFTAVMQIVDQKKTEREQLESAKSGLITAKEHGSLEKGVTIIFGGAEIIFSNPAIWSGEYFCPIKGGLEDFPIKVKIKNDQLFIALDLRDSSGNVIAKLYDNEWVLNEGYYFQRNYDKSALEVIGNDDIPYLQIELFAHKAIRICGVFHMGDHVMIVTESVAANKPFSSLKQLKDDILSAGELKPWFRYPSNKHLGERVK